MLSKEEIENMKLDILNLHHMLGKKPSISKNAIKNALKYIDQLEQDKQKLIEKLEEDIREETGYAKWVDSNTKRISSAVTTMISKRQYAQEILEILKKE